MSSVTGFRQTGRSLRKIAKFPAKQVGQASKKALKPILVGSKANLVSNASYKRGVLFRSMRIRKLKSARMTSTWAVTPTGRGVSIAHLVEAGTKPHYQPKLKRFHPGAKAQPFLEPAYRMYDNTAVKIVVKELGLGMISYANAVAYRGK